MSYPTDDLVPLLAAQPQQGLGFRQGVVLSWNQTNAANTVEVGGTIITDLPVLNTNEAQSLKAGDVVGILTTGAAASSWFILGRITVPGTPAAASSLAAVFSRIVAARDDAMGTRNSDVFGDLTGAAVGPSVTVNISTSGRALVFWSADCGKIAWRRFATGGTSVAVSGATNRAADGNYSLGPFYEHPASGSPGDALVSGGFQGGMMHLFDQLNPGLNTFTMKYRHVAASAGEGPVEFAAREIAVFAM